MKWRSKYATSVFITTIVFGGLIHKAGDAEILSIAHSETTSPLPSEAVATSSVLFTGDIMLGRHVENFMQQHGDMYPFGAIVHLLSEPTLTIGNFEGTVPENHFQTPGGEMQFSIRAEYLNTLKTVGFDVLSLANNHSMDYGVAGLHNTRTLCEKIAVVCGGTSTSLTNDSIRIVNAGEYKVGILFLHTLYVTPNSTDLSAYMNILKDNSDIQIAYVHWGEEYALTHNKAQEKTAHELVDLGVDAVIGHHPHVVQDVELYKNVPIFYSLGNFVFDQYFSTPVQQGLLVRMEIGSSSLRFELHGITSEAEHSKPQLMLPIAEMALFERILSKEAKSTHVDVENGIISI